MLQARTILIYTYNTFQLRSMRYILRNSKFILIVNHKYSRESQILRNLNFNHEPNTFHNWVRVLNTVQS